MIYVDTPLHEFSVKFNIPIEPQFCPCGEVMRMRPVRLSGYAGIESTCDCVLKTKVYVLTPITEEKRAYWKGILSNDCG